MNAEEMRRACGLPEDCEAWAFGGDPDGLAALVKAGRKRATVSAYPLYEIEGEPLPQAGDCGVILNSRDEAVCAIRTTRVYVAPFDEVSERHAALEGEGDLSLACWRAIHREFFTAEMAAAGLAFDEKTPVVCEEFELIDPSHE